MDTEKINYYGSDQIESVSYLEFGGIDLKAAKKTVWAYWHDQQAYDMYMFSRYARDLFAFRRFIADKEYTVARLNDCVKRSAHDKLTDYLFKYAGLITTAQSQPNATVCESGSSLFGWIDEAIACDLVFHDGAHVDAIHKMQYVCSDISDFMNQGAQAFHPALRFRASLAPTISRLMAEIDRLSLFYGLGVSMRYALRDARDILDIARKTDLAIFNRLSVTMETQTVKALYGTGKDCYVISLPALVECLQAHHFTAKYCTANMQTQKDGPNTIRASIAISRNPDQVQAFIQNYDECALKSAEIPDMPRMCSEGGGGGWHMLRDLKAP